MAKFTRDKGLTQSEDYVQKRAKYDEMDEQVRAIVAKIQRAVSLRR